MTAPTVSSTPEWLVRPEAGLCPCGCIGVRSKADFVEKTIGGASDLVRRSMFSDVVAHRDGLLQRVDGRIKVLGLLALLVATALVHHPIVLVALYASTLGLAVVSRLSLRFFVARVWLFVPIFTGVVVLPATFSFVTHGTIVVPLGTWLGSRVGLTEQGLTAAALIVTRVATSTSLVVLLTVTTPWPSLLAALRALLVPRMFILVIGMAYRYVFHLLGSVGDMFTARKARTVGRDADGVRGRAFVAASAGALFGKAHGLSEEVHMAMVARGYRGDATPLIANRLRRADVTLLLAALVLAATTIGVDRALGR